MMFWFALWVINTLGDPRCDKPPREFWLFYMQDKASKFNIKEINDQHKLEIYSAGGLRKS